VSTEAFLDYAAAFEEAYESDNWSVLEAHFTEDATYVVPGGPPLGKTVEGLNNILSSFQSDVNAFDRKFDVRIVEFVEPPFEDRGVVHAPWRGVYRKEGVPDLELRGVEMAHFKGVRLQRLISNVDETQQENVLDWLSKHAAAVGIAP
jgi:hypothetical protein